MRILATVYGATDIGLVRQTNEDSYICIHPHTYIVADGMGGHAAGEVASNILIETAQDILKDDVVYSTNLLADTILKANAAILSCIEKKPEYAGMGTTATMFHYDGNKGIWAHVGDSRIYLLRDGVLQQLTRDHSLVSDMVAQGTITQAEAENHPRKNILLRAVGVEENLMVDTGQLFLEKGDRILLCTDGLSNMLTDADMQNIICDYKGHADKAQELVNAALAAGGLDNVTAIVVVYDA